MATEPTFPPSAVQASLALMRQVMAAMHDVKQSQDRLDRSLQHLYGLFETMNDNEKQ